ncbi:uncharacterized protein LOC132160255 [Carassius carassius]|uniref:uncharacterized protein LOC132160255 n=1 Tax=Carassius carassius TaxID=217509 RepID=UPI00286878FA|nr:uncharacterized protein LOC132160255 [Carassius carassius]
MKLMSVKEGDPVILQTAVPQLTGDELIVWRFGDEGKLIAKHDIEAKSPPLYDDTDERFRDRLKLNDQTGSLIITNTRTTDSGHYKVKISSTKQTIYQKYIVTVSEPGLSPAAVAVIVGAGIVVVVLLATAAAVGLIYHRQMIAEIPETVSGVEGDKVELKTGVTKIQTSDLIEWKGGNKDNLIAQIKEGTITSYEDVFYGVFRDRIKLDMKTGSLTITNPRIEHTGPYKLLINKKLKKRFIVYIKGKTLTVKENDSDTLDTKTELQTGDEIRWMFGDKDALIAEIKGETREMTTYDGPDGIFRDRLELNKMTGSLTIKNITADHAGLYKLLILSSGSTLCSKFFIYVGGVFGADEDEVKSVSVMEGDSVTLNPDPTQIQGFILILWRFGDPVIAQINRKVTSYPSYIELFSGRLQLDQTGFLTINNMRIKHSGLYKIKVIKKAGISNIKFTVTVYESPSAVDAGVTDMKLVSVMEGDPVILQTAVPQLTGDELIVWRFGDEGKLIAKHDIEAKSSPLYDETDESLRDRLKLDQTGSLTITNTRKTDSGHYKVKISSNKQTLYQKYIVTVSEPGLSPAAVAVIVGAGIVVVVLLVIGLIYHCQTIAELPETVSGVERDKVELKTGVTKIQISDLIEWKGNKDNLIAQIKEGTITSYEDVLYGIFRNRLMLDMKTGSLTITNPRIEHTGPYKLLINKKLKKRFIVYIKVGTLTVKENDSDTLDTKTELQTGDEIRWMFGDKDALIAEIKGETREMTTYDGPDGIFRDRLELNKMTGSLTIKNITADHAGLYKLLILSSGSTLCSKFFIYIGESTASE